MLKRFSHVMIYVEKLNRAVAWYTEQLDLPHLLSSQAS